MSGLARIPMWIATVGGWAVVAYTVRTLWQTRQPNPHDKDPRP